MRWWYSRRAVMRRLRRACIIDQSITRLKKIGSLPSCRLTQSLRRTTCLTYIRCLLCERIAVDYCMPNLMGPTKVSRLRHVGSVVQPIGLPYPHVLLQCKSRNKTHGEWLGQAAYGAYAVRSNKSNVVCLRMTKTYGAVVASVGINEGTRFGSSAEHMFNLLVWAC